MFVNCTTELAWFWGFLLVMHFDDISSSSLQVTHLRKTPCNQLVSVIDQLANQPPAEQIMAVAYLAVPQTVCTITKIWSHWNTRTRLSLCCRWKRWWSAVFGCSQALENIHLWVEWSIFRWIPTTSEMNSAGIIAEHQFRLYESLVTAIFH